MIHNEEQRCLYILVDEIKRKRLECMGKTRSFGEDGALHSSVGKGQKIVWKTHMCVDSTGLNL